MPNNIIMLDEELKRRALDKQQEAQETFEDTELTEEEKRVLAEMDREAHTVVTENSVSTPITEYAAPLDVQIAATGADKPFKQVNTGDIVQSIEDQKREARERAIKTFRDLAVSEDELSDDTIVEINNEALESLRTELKVGNLTAELVSSRLGRMNLKAIVGMLPARFVSVYTTESEVKVNNVKAKERIIAALVYLTTIGPEMDYLNEYIENGHRLNLVTERLLQCSVDLVAALQSPEKLSEIADRATEIDPPKDLPWEKYISGGSHQVHNMFARNAAIHEQYVKAYTTLRGEYNDPESIELIDEQIREAQAKVDVYSSICRLDLFKDMVKHTWDWLASSPRTGYKDLEREAMSAIRRIRRCKQDVPFPTYKQTMAKNEGAIYANYMGEFPSMLSTYNSALFQVQDAIRKDGGSEDDLPEFIGIDGIMEATVHHYFSLLLLIVYGRIIKKLTANDRTKYDAILLDEYFVLYCSIGTDTYLMDDVWTIMKPFVKYAIRNWPRPAARSKRT